LERFYRRRKLHTTKRGHPATRGEDTRTALKNTPAKVEIPATRGEDTRTALKNTPAKVEIPATTKEPPTSVTRPSASASLEKAQSQRRSRGV
jgi:hypothetical protein